MGCYTQMETNWGALFIVSADKVITNIRWDMDKSFLERAKPANTPLLRLAKKQLEEYFLKKRKVFDMPLSLQGTVFQKKVWRALMEIPYGETISYGELAFQIGNPGTHRAVGTANAKNPFWIVIPCHRVIRSSGDLGGYAGGFSRKHALLEFESAVMQ